MTRVEAKKKKKMKCFVKVLESSYVLLLFFVFWDALHVTPPLLARHFAPLFSELSCCRSYVVL